MQLIFLPPYSPNFNIIERLWQILKKNVVYDTFYEKIVDFKQAVHHFFDSQTWKPEYDNILTNKFPIIKPDFSASYVR